MRLAYLLIDAASAISSHDLGEITVLKQKLGLTLMLSLALVASTGVGFCLEKGAKGLFFEQMDSPSKSLNTGVQYYIELERGGSNRTVNNKEKFQNGDRIRFHLKSNIDGYAYILLSSGSRGEQSVLFPDPQSGDNNKVSRGKDYTLPESGFLTFDENPGTEKVTLVLSRTPIDAQAYLGNKAEAPTLIASAMTGSKDLIPQKVLVAYNDPAVTKQKFVQETSSSEKIEIKKEKSESGAPKKKIVKKEKETSSSPSISKGAEAKKTSVAKNSNRTSTSVSSHSSHEDGVVTVVSQLPSGVLHIDVDLHHL